MGPSGHRHRRRRGATASHHRAAPPAAAPRRFREVALDCAHKRPWGLGKPYEIIRPFLEAALGKQAFQLATVAPAQAPVAGPGRGHKGEEETTGHDVRSFSDAAAEKQAGGLRSITRAPSEAQDLYRAGLLSQTLAAKLGPAKRTPEQAAQVTEVAQAAVAVVAAEPKPTTPKARRELRRKVDEAVKASLGVTRPAAPGGDLRARLLALASQIAEADLPAAVAALEAMVSTKGAP